MSASQYADAPLGGDLPHRFWTCELCGSQNSDTDGECQWCEDEEKLAREREQDARAEMIEGARHEELYR